MLFLLPLLGKNDYILSKNLIIALLVIIYYYFYLVIM